jgi:hypothetical protein
MTLSSASQISLDEAGDNSSLTRIDPDGARESIILSPLNVMTIAQSAELFRSRRLSRSVPQGAGYSPVFATPAAQIGIHKDALLENILLTLVAPNGASVTYELSPYLANQLSTSIPNHLLEILSTKPKAQ